MRRARAGSPAGWRSSPRPSWRLYVWLEVPAEPALARVYGAIGVLVTYVLTRRIVSRIAMEYLPR